MTHAPALVRQGRFLFRWRNFLPLPAVLYVIGLQRFGPPVDESLFPLLRAGAAVSASAGLAIRGAVVGRLPPGTSSRSTATMATPLLNTLGPYSVVRHPLYVGNLLLWLSVAVLGEHPEGILCALCVFWLSYDRITVAEEHFLNEQFGDVFTQWAGTRPRFLPRFSEYAKSSETFRLGPVLRREFHTLYLLAALYLAVELSRPTDLVGARGSSVWWILTGPIFALVFWAFVDRLYHTRRSSRRASGTGLAE